MENNNRKSIEEMEKEVKIFNEKMKPINDWQREERTKRMVIAQNSEDYNNNICPICGKEIPDRECCNGDPLIDACVCGECDKRYVFPFRMMTATTHKSQLTKFAKSYFCMAMDAELMIEMTKKIKSLSANNTDVA